jgi:hypothetical protein
MEPANGGLETVLESLFQPSRVVPWMTVVLSILFWENVQMALHHRFPVRDNLIGLVVILWVNAPLGMLPHQPLPQLDQHQQE